MMVITCFVFEKINFKFQPGTRTTQTTMNILILISVLMRRVNEALNAFKNL